MEEEDAERSRGLLHRQASHGLANETTKGQLAGGHSRNITEEKSKAEGLTWFCTEYIHNGFCS